MGIIMFGLLCGQLPFELNNKYEQNRLLNGDVVFESYSRDNLNFDNFESVSEEAKDLIKMFLQKDPKKRPSAEEALNHVWFKALGAIQAYMEEENENNINVLSDDDDINELID